VAAVAVLRSRQMSEWLKCGAENSGIEVENRDRGINVSPVPNEVNRIITCDIDCSIVTPRMLCATGCMICGNRKMDKRNSMKDCNNKH